MDVWFRKAELLTCGYNTPPVLGGLDFRKLVEYYKRQSERLDDAVKGIQDLKPEPISHFDMYDQEDKESRT